MKPIRTAIIGTGFMGRVHLDALRRTPGVEVVAVAGRQLAAAQQFADTFGVARAVDDTASLLNDPELDAVHICTPNASHFELAKVAILAGKHVLCEKPVAISVNEARELVTLAGERTIRNCVCHNLRFYPMVQQIRAMRERGELGKILVVQGTYSQDWLLFDTDWNWRIDPAAAGPLRAMADIGSHWFDAAEHLSGLRVGSLCADLQTFHPVRKRPTRAVETFAGKLDAPEETESVAVATEDFGAVLFRLGDTARGSMTASQVAAGRKNHLRIEIYGTLASVVWDQERPEELWVGHRSEANRMVLKDPSLLLPGARSFTNLPGGHAEGYADTFRQLFSRFYSSIAEPAATAAYPTFADGLRQMEILDAELASHRAHAWVDLAPNIAGV